MPKTSIWGRGLVGGPPPTWANGSNDTAFAANVGTGAGPTSSFVEVYTVAVEPGGGMLVGGGYTTWNGTSINYLVRLNADGTRDTTFQSNVGSGPNARVRMIKRRSNGQFFVVGDFTTWSGTTVNRIVRLNADGTRDTTFQSAIGTAAGGPVECVVEQPNGQILLGGSFTTWKGATVARLVRLNADGSNDATFITNAGAGGTVNDFGLQSDGKIIAVGSFTLWRPSVTVGRVVRLNADGTRDATFTTNVGTAANGNIERIGVHTDDTIVIPGSFTTWGGTTVNRIVRLNADGTRDTTFSANTGSGFNDNGYSVLIQTDGRILVGGAFTTFNGGSVPKVVRLNTNGTRDTTFGASHVTAGGASQGVEDIRSNSALQIIVAGASSVTWPGINRLV